MQVSKSNINRKIMCTVIILFWLVMITSSLVAHLYAKYGSEDQAGDVTRVAGFNVGAIGSYKSGYDNIMISVVEDKEPGVYNIMVRNDSEVDVNYDIIFKYGENVKNNTYKGLREKLQITLNGNEPTKKNDDSSIITFSDVGILESNGDYRYNELKFNISQDDYYANMVPNEIFDFDIDVKFVQVD